MLGVLLRQWRVLQIAGLAAVLIAMVNVEVYLPDLMMKASRLALSFA